MRRLGLPEVSPALFAEALLPAAAANPLPSRCQAGSWPAASCHCPIPGTQALACMTPIPLGPPVSSKLASPTTSPSLGPVLAPAKTHHFLTPQPVTGWPWAHQDV